MRFGRPLDDMRYSWRGIGCDLFELRTVGATEEHAIAATAYPPASPTCSFSSMTDSFGSSCTLPMETMRGEHVLHKTRA